MHLSLFHLKNGLLSSLNYSFFIFERYNTLKFSSCQIFLKNFFSFVPYEEEDSHTFPNQSLLVLFFATHL